MPLYCGFPVILPENMNKYDYAEIATLYGVTKDMVFVTDDEHIIGYKIVEEILEPEDMQKFLYESQQKLETMLKKAGYDTIEVCTMNDLDLKSRPISKPLVITRDYEH